MTREIPETILKSNESTHSIATLPIGDDKLFFGMLFTINLIGADQILGRTLNF